VCRAASLPMTTLHRKHLDVALNSIFVRVSPTFLYRLRACSRCTGNPSLQGFSAFPPKWAIGMP
jgi:hypothetical protein